MSWVDEQLAERKRAAAQIAEDAGVGEVANVLNQSADRQQYGQDGWTPEEVWNSSFNPINYAQPVQPANVVQVTPQAQFVPSMESPSAKPSSGEQADAGKSDEDTKRQQIRKEIVESVSPIRNIMKLSDSEIEEKKNTPVERKDESKQDSPNKVTQEMIGNIQRLDPMHPDDVAPQYVVPDEQRSVVVNNGVRSPVEEAVERQFMQNRNLAPSIDKLKGDEGEENYEGSQQQLVDLQRSLQREQERELEKYRDMARNQLLTQVAPGTNPYDDPSFQQRLSQIENMSLDDVSPWMREPERRFPDANPLNWNLLGFTSQTKTPQKAKGIYDYMFAQEDANPIDRNSDEWNARRGTWGKSSVGKKSVAAPSMVNMSFNTMGFNPADDPLYQQQIESASDVPMQSVVDENAIDNGLSPESRESIWMTGRRYLDYVEKYGLPGRDPALIDPDAIYSKQDEMERYGFIPYLETDEAMDKFHDTAAANAVNNLFNGVANLRRNLNGYTYNYGGNTYDGKDFDERYNPWFKKMKDENSEPFTDPSKVNENSMPLTLVMHDSVTGENVFAPTKVDGDVVTTDPETGKPMIDFGTGDPGDNWYFDDIDDLNNSINYELAGDEHPAYAWQDRSPLVLADGQKIRADRAMALNSSKGDYADYGDGNWGKPTVDNPFEDGFAPWITDVALGSAPLFFAPTAAAQAIGNTYSDLQGFKPGQSNSMGAGGRYNLLSEDPTRGEQLMTSTGSAILPSTERIWGNIAGKQALTRFPGWKWLSENHPNVTENPLVIWGTGALGEGLEEIPGNLVEEMQSAGTIGDYFANPLYRDENNDLTTNSKLANGEDAPIAYDDQGKQLRDRNTGFFERVGNFLKEAPLSILGGATLGGALGSVEAAGSVGPYLRDRADRKDEYEKFGYNLEIPEEVKRYTEKQQAGE